MTEHEKANFQVALQSIDRLQQAVVAQNTLLGNIALKLDNRETVPTECIFWKNINTNNIVNVVEIVGPMSLIRISEYDGNGAVLLLNTEIIEIIFGNDVNGKCFVNPVNLTTVSSTDRSKCGPVFSTVFDVRFDYNNAYTAVCAARVAKIKLAIDNNLTGSTIRIGAFR